MATYNLTGSGFQALSRVVSHLQVTITVFGQGFSSGQSVPTNYYKLGSIRLGAGGFFYPPLWLDAQQMLIDVPNNVDTFGYSMITETALTVVEV